MLVKDLIAQLQTMPQDAFIAVPDSQTPSCCCGGCRQFPKDVAAVSLITVSDDIDLDDFVSSKFKHLQDDYDAYTDKLNSTQVVLLWS